MIVTLPGYRFYSDFTQDMKFYMIGCARVRSHLQSVSDVMGPGCKTFWIAGSFTTKGGMDYDIIVAPAAGMSTVVSPMSFFGWCIKVERKTGGFGGCFLRL